MHNKIGDAEPNQANSAGSCSLRSTRSGRTAEPTVRTLPGRCGPLPDVGCFPGRNPHRPVPGRLLRPHRRAAPSDRAAAEPKSSRPFRSGSCPALRSLDTRRGLLLRLWPVRNGRSSPGRRAGPLCPVLSCLPAGGNRVRVGVARPARGPGGRGPACDGTGTGRGVHRARHRARALVPPGAVSCRPVRVPGAATDRTPSHYTALGPPGRHESSAERKSGLRPNHSPADTRPKTSSANGKTHRQEQNSDPTGSQQEHSRRAGADPEGSHRFRRLPEGHGENRGREEGSDEGLPTPREENGPPKGSAEEDLPAGGEESTEQEGGPGESFCEEEGYDRRDEEEESRQTALSTRKKPDERRSVFETDRLTGARRRLCVSSLVREFVAFSELPVTWELSGSLLFCDR